MCENKSIYKKNLYDRWFANSKNQYWSCLLYTSIYKSTNIPVSKLVQGDKEKLLGLKDTLAKRVIGQDEALTLVSDAIIRQRSGIKDENRPIGSFLFLGPTGVGKTEVCKSLAEALFDSESHIVRFDMSEYMEPHSVSRLIGAPPGYVGYDLSLIHI